MQMQSSENAVPALLDKNFSGVIAMSMTHYKEEGVYVLKDKQGTDVLDEDFKYINQ